MNQANHPNTQPVTEENVLFGIIGAFLFSLVGGVCYVLLGMVGFIASISGLIGVVCAIKGYTFFSKGESKKGVIISVVIAAIVLIVAWYVGFCIDMLNAYQGWFETGEVDYVPSFFEYFPYGVYDLTVNLDYFLNLFISLGLGAVGCWSYVTKMLKREKSMAEAPAFEPQQSTIFPNEAYPTAPPEGSYPTAPEEVTAEAAAEVASNEPTSEAEENV